MIGKTWWCPRERPWLLFVQLVFAVLCSSMQLVAQSSDKKIADAYTAELKLLNSQRTAILKDASILIQQNNQLLLKAMAAQANAMRSAAVADATPDVSVRTRTVVPSKKGSSSSSSNSINKDAIVETTASSNMGFKSQMAVESNLWTLQSQMNMAAMQQVNAVFSKVVQRLVDNLKGYCQVTDIYGQRCRLEAQVAKELTTDWLTADPEDTGAMLIRAAALRSLGEIDAAKALALKAKQIPTPARPIAAALLAQCLYLEGNTTEARSEIIIANRLAQGTQFGEPAVVAALLNLADNKKLRNGDTVATTLLWESYFGRLVHLARGRISSRNRLGLDGEDIALSAFKSFCSGLERGRFPKLTDKQDLWNILAAITLNKTLRAIRDEGRKKRGGDIKIQGQNDLHFDLSLLDQLISAEPTPEMAMQFAEDVQQLLAKLDSQELTDLALLKLNGHSNAEIATKLGCAERTIERKLNLIRRIWDKSAGA